MSELVWILIVIIPFNPGILQCENSRVRGGNEVSQGTPLREFRPPDRPALFLLTALCMSYIYQRLLPLRYQARSFTPRMGYIVALYQIRKRKHSCPRTLTWFWQCLEPFFVPTSRSITYYLFRALGKLPRSDQYNDERWRGQHSVGERGPQVLYIYRVNTGNVLFRLSSPL